LGFKLKDGIIFLIIFSLKHISVGFHFEIFNDKKKRKENSTPWVEIQNMALFYMILWFRLVH